MEGLPQRAGTSPVFIALGNSLRGQDLMTMTLLALNPDIHAALEVHLGNHEAFLDLCNTMIEENMLAKIGEHEGELLDHEEHSCTDWAEKGPRLAMLDSAHGPTLVSNSAGVASSAATGVSELMKAHPSATASMLQHYAGSNVAKVGGPVLMTAVFGLECVDHITQWRRGEISGKRCAVRVSRSLASMGGTIKGIALGAAAGAPAGPAGSIVGGVVGGICGMFAAGQLADWLMRGWFGLPSEEAVEKAYRTLGVPCDAPISDINKAYRLLLKEFHPDNRDGGNVEKFIAVQVAMEVVRSHRQKCKKKSRPAMAIEGKSDSQTGEVLYESSSDEEFSEDGHDEDSESDFEETTFDGTKLDVEIEGPLKKAGCSSFSQWFNRKFKKRYVVLASDGRLTYFKDDSKHKKRGELVLQHGTKCGPHGKDDFAFFLKTPSGKRTWIFAASSAEERDLWIESMELIIAERPLSLEAQVSLVEPELSRLREDYFAAESGSERNDIGTPNSDYAHERLEKQTSVQSGELSEDLKELPGEVNNENSV